MPVANLYRVAVKFEVFNRKIAFLLLLFCFAFFFFFFFGGGEWAIICYIKSWGVLLK